MHSDRRHQFAVERAELWASMCRVDRYREWWPWLRSFEASALRSGDRWRCRVQPPLPYALRFDVTIDEVVPGELVTATVSGDIAGTARLDLLDRVGGSEIRLASSLAPSNRMLRAVALAARPVVRRGHDWVLDTGARQFTERALPPPS